MREDRKKALVVGGASGIGLAVALELVRSGYMVYIMDLREPLAGTLPKGTWEYEYADMRQLDEGQLQKYVEDPYLEFLMITVGIGRVGDFRTVSTAEVREMIGVNATAVVVLLKIFYSRLLSQEKFCCGVMGSIAGFISSPAVAVYAASKAALCRFIESVNIELETAGTRNRILDVSPGNIKGTGFDGGETNLSLLSGLAKEIVERVQCSETLYIPQYEEKFRGVLERYHADPHAFGLQSYEYKRASGRMTDAPRTIGGYLSGTFDLFHVGHLNLLRRAKEQCGWLTVGVHRSGLRKGKETFIPLDERKDIIRACRYVDEVIDAPEEDSDAWGVLRYQKLFVGSDYKGTERFLRYEKYFRNKGVEIIYLPYTTGTSSTQIRELIVKG